MPTETALLEYLARHPAASARELARATGSSLSNIRYHLDRLIEHGSIEVVEQRLGSRGRPTLLYGLAPRQRSGLLAPLCMVLLRIFTATAGSGGPSPREAAAALASEVGLRPADPAAGLSARLRALTAQLQAVHSPARWEAREGGPLLLVGPCPYANLPAVEPAVCDFDRGFLEYGLGAPLVLLRRSMHGRCVFQIPTVPGPASAGPTAPPAATPAAA